MGEKRNGQFKLIKHIGCTSTNDGIQAIKVKAKQELEDLIFKNQPSLFPEIKKSFKAKLLNWYSERKTKCRFLIKITRGYLCLKLFSENLPFSFAVTILGLP